MAVKRTYASLDRVVPALESIYLIVVYIGSIRYQEHQLHPRNQLYRTTAIAVVRYSWFILFFANELLE
jgi:hypothetical protein